MSINLMQTLKSIESKLNQPGLSLDGLHKAYGATLRLRSQILGVIYEKETFGCATRRTLADSLSEGQINGEEVILTLREPLPALKELTSDLQDHWIDLIHTAIANAAKKQQLPYFNYAFVWIEIITPKGNNNSNLWDTSNRAVNLIINNLKGIFFEDDNYEHMAFGVVARWGEKGVTMIHIMDYNKLRQSLCREITGSP